MNHVKKPFILILLLLFTASAVFSQEDVLRPNGRPEGEMGYKKSRKKPKFTVGAELGLNFNFFSQTQSWNFQDAPTAYNANMFGFGVSPLFNGLFDFHLSNKVGIQLRLGFEMKQFGNSGSGYDYIEEGPYRVVLDYSYSASATYLSFAPLFRYNFTENLFITAGPVFHALLTDLSVSHTGKTLDGSNLANTYWWKNVSGDSAGPSYTYDAVSTGQTSFRIALEAGIGYKIPIGKSMWIVPQGRFQFFLTPIADDYNVNFSTNALIQENTSRYLHSAQVVCILV